jgi:uncharacterized membrane protein YfcA
MLAAVLTLIALLASTLSGMAGIGGGTILIAAMYAVGLTPTVAVPVHAGVQLVSNFSRTLAYLRHVEWRALRDFLIGAAPAPFLVAPLIARANEHWLLITMAGFIYLTLWPRWLKWLRLEGRAGMVAAGVITGGLGSLVGATGTLIAPLFLRSDWRKETTIATLALCQAIAHLLKIIAFATVGYGLFEHWQLLLPMVLAVVVGTLIGSRLHGRLSEERFVGMFRLILGALATKLLYDGAMGLLAA